MMKGGHGQTNQLHVINRGALDHASRAPHLMSCNYHVCECVYACCVQAVYTHIHTADRCRDLITGNKAYCAQHTLPQDNVTYILIGSNAYSA